MLKKKIVIIELICAMLACMMISGCVNDENGIDEWTKIKMEDYEFYDNGIITLDLDGDETEEEIEIFEYGKYIYINEERHLINPRAVNDELKELELPIFVRTCEENQYHILDINNDGIMEIIHRTFSLSISPITSFYTIYNYYNGQLYVVGEFDIVGNIPEKISVKGNSLKFKYWEYESPRNKTKSVKLVLDLSYKN